MTKGLVKSRGVKIQLLKKSINSPTPENINRYKSYRNLFNKLIRIRKKDFTLEKLNENSKDPRKTWEILKNLTGSHRIVEKVTELKIDNVVLSDPNIIAEEFNSFFSGAGKRVAESVRPTNCNPMDFFPDNEPPVEDLVFREMTQADLINIITNMESKSSVDINGINMKLIKHVKYQIAVPLLHIFNESSNGNFSRGTQNQQNYSNL
jgi:hypothetical protein